MSLVVLLILAVVWAVFLVPQALRLRAERTHSDSIGAFRNQLSVLERTTPGLPSHLPTFGARSLASTAARPVSAREAVRRRRQAILVRLLAAMGVTLVGGLVFPKLLVVHALLDVLFVAYCAMLVRARNVAAERDLKVHYLPGPAYSPAHPTLLLRQSGS